MVWKESLRVGKFSVGVSIAFFVENLDFISFWVFGCTLNPSKDMDLLILWIGLEEDWKILL